MTRHTYAPTKDIEPVRRPSAPAAAHLPPGPAAMLALQRQVGNVAVSRMLEVQRMPGSWPETDDGPVASTSAAPSPAAPTLDSFGETALDVDQISLPSAEAPSPTLSTIAEESEAESIGSRDSLPPRPSGPTPDDPRNRAAADAAAAARPSGPTPDDPRNQAAADAAFEPKPSRYFNGDIPKAVGAGAGLAVPAMNLRLVDSAVPNLGSGSTGVAAAGAVGDAMSEIVRWNRGEGLNLPKFIGGVLSSAGLVTNAIGQGVRSDNTRYGGLGLQTLGLLSKSAGEGYMFETGWPDFSAIPSGDISKMVGAFVASAGPILTATAINYQRTIEREIAAGTRSGGVPTSQMAVWAALLGGGTAAGDFASEVVKGVRDRKVNVPKMMGGLFSAAGAVSVMAGVATGNKAARTAGFALQEFGLSFKAAGESTRFEDIWPRLPQKQKPADVEMGNLG